MNMIQDVVANGKSGAMVGQKVQLPELHLVNDANATGLVCSLVRLYTLGSNEYVDGKLSTFDEASFISRAKTCADQYEKSCYRIDRDSAVLAIVTSDQASYPFLTSKEAKAYGWSVFNVAHYKKYNHQIAYCIISGQDFYDMCYGTKMSLPIVETAKAA